MDRGVVIASSGLVWVVTVGELGHEERGEDMAGTLLRQGGDLVVSLEKEGDIVVDHSVIQPSAWAECAKGMVSQW